MIFIVPNTDCDSRLAELQKHARSLYWYNVACFLLHLTSAVVLIVLTGTSDTWPVYATKRNIEWVPVNASEAGESCTDVKCMIKVEETSTGELSLEWMVVAFHSCSVLAHLWNLTHQSTYYAWLARKMNPGRWVEYFFSASLMQVVIQILTGFTDVWNLSMAAVLIAVTQLFGHATEQFLYYSKNALAPVERWQFFWFGCVSFCVPWVAILYTFFESAENSDPGPPKWVYGIIFSLLFTFGSFAVVMAWYVRHWSDTFVSFKSERYYCILSLVAKTILTWQLYFGAFARAKNDVEAYNP